MVHLLAALAQLNKQLGIIPFYLLIIIFARAEMFAQKNGPLLGLDA